jgi:hypothetical protein
MISRQASDVNMLNSITSLAAREEFNVKHFNMVRDCCNYLRLNNEQLKDIMKRLEQSLVEGLQSGKIVRERQAI